MKPQRQHRSLAEAGYQAALNGQPCGAPAASESDRRSWEMGWRAGHREVESGGVSPAVASAIKSELYFAEFVSGRIVIHLGKEELELAPCLPGEGMEVNRFINLMREITNGINQHVNLRKGQ